MREIIKNSLRSVWGLVGDLKWNEMRYYEVEIKWRTFCARVLKCWFSISAENLKKLSILCLIWNSSIIFSSLSYILKLWVLRWDLWWVSKKIITRYFSFWQGWWIINSAWLKSVYSPQRQKSCQPSLFPPQDSFPIKFTQSNPPDLIKNEKTFFKNLNFLPTKTNKKFTFYWRLRTRHNYFWAWWRF